MASVQSGGLSNTGTFGEEHRLVVLTVMRKLLGRWWVWQQLDFKQPSQEHWWKGGAGSPVLVRTKKEGLGLLSSAESESAPVTGSLAQVALHITCRHLASSSRLAQTFLRHTGCITKILADRQLLLSSSFSCCSYRRYALGCSLHSAQTHPHGGWRCASR